jgi:4-amino-4-deoxychorismate lyase
MYPLVETLKVQGRKLFHVKYHNKRLNLARKKLFDIDVGVDLQDFIQLPDNLNEGMYKCRLLYGKDMGTIEFVPYQIKNIQSLKIVEADEIDYTFKYLNRDSLNYLLSLKGQCDDIIIVKKGMVTDSSSGNLIFHDGHEWITPSNPLLEGTCRQRLLENKKIKAAGIKATDIHRFKEVKIINAMRDMEVSGIAIDNVFF